MNLTCLYGQQNSIPMEQNHASPKDGVGMGGSPEFLCFTGVATEMPGLLTLEVVYENHLEGRRQVNFNSWTPSSDSVDLGLGLAICISSQLPGDAVGPV